jgi:hypothetical protein
MQQNETIEQYMTVCDALDDSSCGDEALKNIFDYWWRFNKTAEQIIKNCEEFQSLEKIA